MTERNIAPQPVTPNLLPSLHFTKHMVSGVLPVYMPGEADEDLLRISFVFDAGNLRSEQPALASSVSKLLLSGTANSTADELNEKLDLYGSYIELDHGHDDSCMNIFCLRKHVPSLLEIVEEIFTSANFPETELSIHKDRSKESLRVNQEKTSFLARRACMKALFGETIYGRSAEMEDYDNLEREQIMTFFRSNYQQGLKYILVNSALDPEIFRPFFPFAQKVWKEFPGISFTNINDTISVHKEDAVQASIMLAMPFVNRTHPDFMSLAVLNTAFGGYFGSRLMKNIREEKGYTYGIGSSIHSLYQAGYLSIKTDVGNDVKDDAVKEIMKEMEMVKDALIPDDELQTVRNYMAGSLQRNFDGSLALCDRFKTILDFGLDTDHYHEYLKTILSVQPDKLLMLAKKYYGTNIITVIAGRFET